jgi:hypothetical protein
MKLRILDDIFQLQHKFLDLREDEKDMIKKNIRKNMDKLKIYYNIEDVYRNEEMFANFMKDYVIYLPGINVIENELNIIFEDIEVDDTIIT